jgi:hypothetical protein
MKINYMILWLDDMRNPKQFGFYEVIWAKTYNEAIAVLSSEKITFASLDHDIGACSACVKKQLHIGTMMTPETTFFNTCPHEKTGYDVICWIEKHNMWPCNGIIVHSANPIGRNKMNKVILKHYGHLFEI